MKNDMSLQELSTLRDKTDRVRHIFMDMADGHTKHNILNAWLTHWEDPSITSRKFGVDIKDILRLREEAVQAVETYWFSKHGDGLPEIKRVEATAPITTGERALNKYLEDVCETFNKDATLADLINSN